MKHESSKLRPPGLLRFSADVQWTKWTCNHSIQLVGCSVRLCEIHSVIVDLFYLLGHCPYSCSFSHASLALLISHYRASSLDIAPSLSCLVHRTLLSLAAIYLICLCKCLLSFYLLSQNLLCFLLLAVNFFTILFCYNLISRCCSHCCS